MNDPQLVEAVGLLNEQRDVEARTKAFLKRRGDFYAIPDVALKLWIAERVAQQARAKDYIDPTKL